MPVQFPTQSPSIASGIVLAALALAGPAVSNADAVPLSAQASASASASLQLDAQSSTDKAVRLAKRSAGTATRTLATTREQLRRAQVLTVTAVSQGEADVAGAAGAQFSASFSAQAEDLATIVKRTEGRVEAAAVATARELSRLNGEVTAALASRADVGADAEVTGAVAASDAEHVRVIGSLTATLRGPDLAGRVRKAMTEAAGAVVVLRGAVATRLQGLRAAATGTVQPALTSALTATSSGSATVAKDVRTLLDAGVDVQAGASVELTASSSAGMPGVSLVADAVARLGGPKAALRAALRGHA